jgi:hypothetical protein
MPHLDPGFEELLPEGSMLDPEKPIDPDRLAAEFVSAEDRRSAENRLTLVVSLLVVFSGFAAWWRWTPLKQWINTETLFAAVASLQQMPGAPFLGAFRLRGRFASRCAYYRNCRSDGSGIRHSARFCLRLLRLTLRGNRVILAGAYAWPRSYN